MTKPWLSAGVGQGPAGRTRSTIAPHDRQVTWWRTPALASKSGVVGTVAVSRIFWNQSRISFAVSAKGRLPDGEPVSR